MNTTRFAIALSALASVSSLAHAARAEAIACDHIVTTNERTFSIDKDSLPIGGAAAHGGHVLPHLAPASSFCEDLDFTTMIQTFADGAGFCAFRDEQVVSYSQTLCQTECRYAVETTHRIIDPEYDYPGIGAANGGYVTPHIAPANARCQAFGSRMIVMFENGEGYCARPNELILSAGSGPCPATCNFNVETTEGTINIDLALPGEAEARGGRVLPHLAPANSRCLSEGYVTMIVAFADGEGLCAEPGVNVLRVSPDGCDVN